MLLDEDPIEESTDEEYGRQYLLRAMSVAAERLGYEFVTRHQPQTDFEEPNWIVVVHTPNGRLPFPGTVDSVEVDARIRSIDVTARDLASRSV